MLREENLFIVERLKADADEAFRAFTIKSLPTVEPETIIGVRAPLLQKFGRELAASEGAVEQFLSDLPHRYHEENLLHAYLLSELDNVEEYAQSLKAVEEFLPYADNRAVSDAINPKVFAQHPNGLEKKIEGWLRSDRHYTVRFGLSMLTRHYLDEFFDEEHFQWVIDVSSTAYYVQMAQAWYFASALAKRYEQTVPLLENEMLEPTVHGMTIQKALNSQRIPYERKRHLRSLKLSGRH